MADENPQQSGGFSAQVQTGGGGGGNASAAATPKPGPSSAPQQTQQASRPLSADAVEETAQRRSKEDPNGGAEGDLSGVFTSTENPGASEGDLSALTGRDEQASSR